MNKEKYNYLTSDEANMSNEEINLQISLGLQSCKTKKDVCDLLEDIRTHERQKWQSAVALLKKKINGNECGEFDEDANFWCYRMELIEKAIDECFQIQEQEAVK